MSDPVPVRVVVVDYAMGNLFSVKRACEHVGIEAKITASGEEILRADGVILPGVGAFGDAMATLERLGLVGVLREVVRSGKPLVGICLGMQLLMNESYEFGRHWGLEIIQGDVVRLQGAPTASRGLKVPQVGWNGIYRTSGMVSLGRESRVHGLWERTPLEGLSDGEFMYFVHSYYVRPLDPSLVLSTTRYGPVEFCSSFRRGNIFGFQFHPERSGRQGLQIYSNLAVLIRRWKLEHNDAGTVGNEVRFT